MKLDREIVLSAMPRAEATRKAVLVLEDGTVFWGRGLGAVGQAVGEVCFNTSMTGYQEVLTDPSYAGQIITFTFPHIGNVGTNVEDIESRSPACRGLVLREDISLPANWRAHGSLNEWLNNHNLTAIAGIDTRHLASRIRDLGAPKGCLAFNADGRYDMAQLQRAAALWPGLEGIDLTGEVSCAEPYEWAETLWSIGDGYGEVQVADRHVVCVDYGIKRNILRYLADLGCRITVVPARSSAVSILALRPDGVVLSNGPGDPSATGAFAVPVIQDLLASRLPIFGICLGHQLLALALGARTVKLPLGHRGGNHPVQDLATGRVEITSQNHGFAVLRKSLPLGVEETHTSLFDGSVEGLRMKDRPIFHRAVPPGGQPRTTGQPPSLSAVRDLLR